MVVAAAAAAAPAALTLRSWATIPQSQANRSFLPAPTYRLPHNSFQNRIKQSVLRTNGRASIRSASLTTAVAVDSSQIGSSEAAEKEIPKRYYFVIANAKFMLDEEEHFHELLFERLRNYGERDKEQDFWLVIEPKFLDKFPKITNRLKRPAVALVSTNAAWITFMKLRLDRVLADNFEADSLEEALASNPTELKFEKPENWVAPYPKYEFGWWEPFLPPGSAKATV